MAKPWPESVVWIALALLPATACADSVQDNLSNMSLEELSNVRITSVSRREERLADAAAAVFVISADDIRRSGAQSLPEALRLAPNLQVSQAYSSGYVISARGFANNDGNKLLVLIDGRSVYTPLFSGVFWDAQDLPLDDIERIEVISGPGGTLWGTNAVNGVINVITKPASATQGGALALGGGTLRADAGARYGGRFGEDGAWRLYAKSFRVKHTETASGDVADDAWHQSQVGFRADWRQARDQFTLQGDAYRGRHGQPKPGNISLTGVNVPLGNVVLGGGNLMARWTRNFDGGGNLSVQAYYDRTERDLPPFFNENLDTVSLQAQYAMAPIGRHAPTFGAEYRRSKDSLENSAIIGFLPADDSKSWTSLYAQDEIALSSVWKLTLGARVERNDYTGNEFLPNARLAWQVADDHLLWAAVSRTVRAPSRLDVEVFFPSKPPFILAGGPGFRSEVARFFELGYRGRLGQDFSYSVNLYRALYDDLHTQELAPSRTSVFFGNGMKGSTRGLEAWASWQVQKDWRLSAAFTALHEHFWLKPGSIDTAASVSRMGHDPRHTATLRSSWQIGDDREFDVALRHVGKLTSPDVPAYRALDMRFGWRIQPTLELSLTGTNLIGPDHGEFTPIETRSVIKRAVYLGLSKRF
ncbi:TonB-dependent siderophore receptor [Massilia sp. NR 4-1]|uniref:TonB-dependent receptor plug domain-containing protein n=1 Tax=Massilia sp. NR 4-1 TaxID=1678028 RepID=UPI0009E193A5|nr:TonB-dependent receptor [Massilia sp. NR 4-1]